MQHKYVLSPFISLFLPQYKRSLKFELIQGFTHCLLTNQKATHISISIQADAGEAGINMIVEMLANVNLERDLEMLSTHGRVVVVGNRGTIEINPRHTMAKESSVIGCMLGLSTTVSGHVYFLYN